MKYLLTVILLFTGCQNSGATAAKACKDHAILGEWREVTSNQGYLFLETCIVYDTFTSTELGNPKAFTITGTNSGTIVINGGDITYAISSDSVGVILDVVDVTTASNFTYRPAP